MAVVVGTGSQDFRGFSTGLEHLLKGGGFEMEQRPSLVL